VILATRSTLCPAEFLAPTEIDLRVPRQFVKSCWYSCLSARQILVEMNSPRCQRSLRALRMCRRAKTQPKMAASLYPLLISPIPWGTVGLDYLKHLLLSNEFDRVLIVVDHLTRMAHFLARTKSVTAQETSNLFL
jgi:hypothetical protein